jgi:hypothetical protein
MQYIGVRANTGWLETRIMCLSGATCLPVNSNTILVSSQPVFELTGRHVAQLRHIILVSSQPVFELPGRHVAPLRHIILVRIMCLS